MTVAVFHLLDRVIGILILKARGALCIISLTCLVVFCEI